MRRVFCHLILLACLSLWLVAWNAALCLSADSDAAAAVELPTLLEQLTDDDPNVRAAAAVSLGRLASEPETVLPRLLECFDDRAAAQVDGNKAEVWYFAALAAGEYGEAVVPMVIDLLQQDDRQRRVGASLVIMVLGPEAKDVLPTLIEALHTADLETRRPALMSAMLSLGVEAKPAMPLMMEFLGDEDFHTQYWACRVLGAIGAEAHVAAPALVDLLQHGVASVRRNAAAALGRIGPGSGPQALDALIRALNDPIQPIREQAAIALGRLGDFAEPAVPALEEVLSDDSNFAARSRAAEALWRLSPDSPTPLRVLLAQVQDTEESDVAAVILGEIGNDLGAAESLVPLLEAPETRTRIHVAWALGLMGQHSQQAIAVLESFLDDPEPDYRNEARVALNQIRERD